MVKVNGIQLDEYAVHRAPYQFAFNDAATGLAFSPFSSVRLRRGPQSDIDPTNPASPLANWRRGETLVEFDDTGDQLVALSGFLDHVSVTDDSIDLRLVDRLEARLNSPQVVVGAVNRTPVQILIDIALAYGIEVAPVGIGVTVGRQASDGLLFDFSITVDDQLSVRDTIETLCQAGWMKATIWNSKLYITDALFPVQATLGGIIIRQSDILSTVSSQTISSDLTIGGRVNWLGGVYEEVTPVDAAGFSANYGAGQDLTLRTISGAAALIRYSASDRNLRRLEFDLDWQAALNLEPGTVVTLEAGIVDDLEPVAARFVGSRRLEADYDAATVTFEVRGIRDV